MRIAVIGTRGIPGIQGGIETHCENLYPRLVKLGCEITVIRRNGYVNKEIFDGEEFEGVKIIDAYSPKIKSFEAIVHSLVGLIYAKKIRAEIVHIHAIGPSLVAPLARLLGLKVVVTHHGPDYNRQKWNKTAKAMLRFGEKMAARYANKIIVISDVIKKLMIDKYNCRSKLELIFNGVELPTMLPQTDYIKSLGLETQKYVIAVGRFVEEKGFHDLIDAFERIKTDCKLVLVGDADISSVYSEKLKDKARRSGVILTGFIKGDSLKQIFTHARVFVLPSYHEGLPIALLEAMSYNLNVLVSDIPANMEVDLDHENYFKVGDIKELSHKLERKLQGDRGSNSFRKVIEENYDWDSIAKQTYNVYKSVSLRLPVVAFEQDILQECIE